jgi:hypothetical protein
MRVVMLALPLEPLVAVPLMWVEYWVTGSLPVVEVVA